MHHLRTNARAPPRQVVAQEEVAVEVALLQEAAEVAARREEEATARREAADPPEEKPKVLSKQPVASKLLHPISSVPHRHESQSFCDDLRAKWTQNDRWQCQAHKSLPFVINRT